jgi:hypothetical protein
MKSTYGMGARLGFVRTQNTTSTSTTPARPFPWIVADDDVGEISFDSMAETLLEVLPLPDVECGPPPAGSSSPDPLDRLLEEVGETRPVEALMALLADHDEPLTPARVGLLRELTCQRFGTDRQGWLHWWERNRHRDRVEWLIDGIIDENPRSREASTAELSRLIGKPILLEPDLEPSELEAIRQEWLEWWSYKKWIAGKRLL